MQVLQQLRDTGNTVLVVEHERCVMQEADHIIDLGPGTEPPVAQSFSKALILPFCVTDRALPDNT